MAQSFLDTLLGGVKNLTGGQSASDLAGKAKETWNNQSTLTKGAIAGGLLGVLLSGNARKLVGTGAKVGGAALIGGLAYKAYEDWKNGKALQTADQPLTLPEPAATSDDLAQRLLQAMVAASKADGHVTAEERARIAVQLPKLGLGAEAEAMLAAELDTPLDIDRIAALATTEREAAAIYTASALVVDVEAPAERAYLAALAQRLKLDAGLLTHLNANAAALA